MIASLAVLSTALLTAGAGMEPSPWPSVEELPRLDDLPDPFTFRDGGRVATPEDWRRRRTEIESMLSHYEYGHMPPPVPSINVEKQSVKAMWDGEAELREADLLMGPDHKLRMHVGYYLPLGKQGPFPVLLALEPVWKEALWPVAQRAAVGGEAVDIEPLPTQPIGTRFSLDLKLWVKGPHRIVKMGFCNPSLTDVRNP